MTLELNRKELPFVFEVKNEAGAACVVDAAPEIGGKNKGLRPMELLAGSLAACISIDLLGILKKQRVETEQWKITIDADRKEGIPSPFEHLHLTFHVDSHMDKKKLNRNISLVLEKYCSVSASLDKAIEISYEIKTIL